MIKQIKDPDIFTVFNEIGIIEQLSRSAFERVLPHGLKVSHFSLLNHLVRLGDGQSPSHMAKAFQVTKAAITNTLGRLEAKGFVRVRPNPSDARAKLVFLTPTGKRARNESLAALEPTLTQLALVVPQDEFSAVLPFLQTLRATFDRARD